jgi:stage II sporulation protein D
MSRRPLPRRGTILTAMMAAALLSASPAAAMAEPVDPQPEWGVDALRETDALVTPQATTPNEQADAYLLDQSTAAASTAWALSGSGWGHGVGMSQYGAWEMARDGYTAPQILGHYYTDTTYDLVADTAVISVNLRSAVSSSTMTTSALSSGGGSVTVTAGGTTMTGGVGATLTARAQSGGSGVTVTCATCSPVTAVTGSRVAVQWDDNRTLLAVDGTRYKDGRVSVTRAGTTTNLNVVAQVRVHDEYLDYIAEMPWSWHSEALKAQAAAARGYALSALARGLRTSCDCHLFDTSVSQVFGGYPSSANLPYWPRWTGAVRAAGSADRGYVVRHNGAIIEAFYSSSSGGRTQNNEDVWGGTARPYLRSVSDPWSLRSSNSRATWTAQRDPAAMASAFGLTDVARVDLSNRYVSGAVARATATSSAGSARTITGAQLSSRLGLFSSYVTRHSIRHGGPDRYATAAAVASAIPVSASAVVIASGEPDSLIDATVGGPLAGAVGAPILLTRLGALPPATVAELDRRSGSLRTAYILGSEGTVSETVATALRARGLTVVRLGGPNRYATARLVAAEVAKHRSVTSVVVAAGFAIPDVVSSSGPSAALGQPILLTRPTTLSPDAAASLSALRPTTAYLVGNWVTGAAESSIRSSVPTVTRLSGSDRFGTAAAIARHFAPRLPTYNRVVISSGLDANLVDAISAGPLAQPMLFVRPTSVPPATTEAVQRMPQAGRVDLVLGDPGRDLAQDEPVRR